MAKRRTETNFPVNKVTGGGISGGILTFLMVVFEDQMPEFFNEELQKAAIVLISFIVSYFVNPGEKDGIKHTRS